MRGHQSFFFPTFRPARRNHQPFLLNDVPFLPLTPSDTIHLFRDETGQSVRRGDIGTLAFSECAIPSCP